MSMHQERLPTAEFCWYPTELIPSLSQAVHFESVRLGMGGGSKSLFLAACLQAVRQLELGNLRGGRDFRSISLAQPQSLFELRFSFSAESENHARLYFTRLQNPEVTIGLLLRVKNIDGARAQIRQLQNVDISQAIFLLEIAKNDKYAKCLPGDS